MTRPLRLGAPAPAVPAVAGPVLARSGAVAGAALVLAVLLVPGEGPPLCLLRAATGVPCPFCGGTTAMVHLGEGRFGTALATSPLAVLGAPVWAAWPALRRRWAAARSRLGAPGSVAVLLLVLAGSWLWQLQRVLA